MAASIDPELFRLGGKELKAVAEGRTSKRQAAAVAEQKRRKAKKSAKRSARSEA